MLPIRPINLSMARQSTVKKAVSDSIVDIRKTRRKRISANNDKAFFSSREQREAVSFLLVTSAVILFLSLLLNPSELRGIQTSEVPTATGLFGKWVATRFGIFFGFGSLIIPIAMALAGIGIYRGVTARKFFAKGLALTVCLIATCAFLGLIAPDGYLGGSLGMRLADDLFSTFGYVSFLIVFLCLVTAVVIGTPLSFSAVFSLLFAGAALAGRILLQGRDLVAGIFRHSPANESRPEEPQARGEKPGRSGKGKGSKRETSEEESAKRGPEYYEKAETRIIKTPALKLVHPEPASGESSPEPDSSPPEDSETRSPVAPPTVPADAQEVTADMPEPEPAQEGPFPVAIPEPKEEEPEEKPAAARPEVIAEEEDDDEDYLCEDEFRIPPLSLLNNPEMTESVTEEELRAKAMDLQNRLADFNIECKIGHIIPGPTVTRFEIVPAPGVKVSAIKAREDDIALAMAAPSIRIEAPIPGKAAVGVEIPNRRPQCVTLKEVLASTEYQDLRNQTPLAVALGKDIAGRPVVADLRRMPHLLIAGSTGSGKSVCINAIVNSLILSSRPTEVKLLLVDPKVVELQGYNGIPHLLAPVITDVRKAPQALMWAVEEMERRYRYLARAGVRDIESYNRKAMESEPEIDEFVDVEDELAPQREMPSRMPYIVVIVDEFGDLMMVAAKEAEEAIIRIAQMARAVGIHLIIATQRPSVDVITGVIKANLPSRIAFFVSSRVDSRTILDSQGAERLLGRGDMLFKPGDKPKPIRLQGSFIETEEIKRVIQYYTDQGKIRYEFNLQNGATELGPGPDLAEESDPLFEQALKIVLEDGQASVSRLQRRLKIGHPRAARLVDIMEARGLVTPPDGSKPRQLLFDESYFENDGD
ncbi:MAG: DNA translocase FtsK [Candidatus Hydrogenedentota bacterium]|nr:MAG: DNA translocase FtsK [Candidatus Hydrogenedentota bacterium]